MPDPYINALTADVLPHTCLVMKDVVQLFAASGLESEQFAASEELSNHMGLFLQVSHVLDADTNGDRAALCTRPFILTLKATHRSSHP